MSEVPKSAARWWVFATLMIVLAYVFAMFVAFSDHAVMLTVCIPAALGSLGLGVTIWVIAVVREARRKGVL